MNQYINNMQAYLADMIDRYYIQALLNKVERKLYFFNFNFLIMISYQDALFSFISQEPIKEFKTYKIKSITYPAEYEHYITGQKKTLYKTYHFNYIEEKTYIKMPKCIWYKEDKKSI